MNVLSLVEKLFPFSYSITGAGNDESIPVYQSELNFTVHEYASNQSLNGWYIPDAWRVIKAQIFHNEQLVYDAGISPLGVATLSPSFNGELSLAELNQHLISCEQLPDAIPYQWQNLYRPNEINWALCMPDKIKQNLANGTYQVTLATETSASTMKVLDYFLPGHSDETIIINGHNCHPFQANDDISGCAVAIRVMQALKQQAKLKCSYRIIIAPELHGPMFWLNELANDERENLKGCILLKSVGNKADMRLQRSYGGDSALDLAAQSALTQRYQTFEQDAFRTIYGNDETVFEAPPYNIPTISLTRWPFKQYHTDLDTPDTLCEQTLQDSVDLVLDIIASYEKRNNPPSPNNEEVYKKVNLAAESKYLQTYQRNFDGLVCLSAYGLYKSIPQVENTGVDYNSLSGRWNTLMNCLPREIEAKQNVAQLADKYQLPVEEVYQYLELWVENNLLIKEHN